MILSLQTRLSMRCAGLSVAEVVHTQSLAIMALTLWVPKENLSKLLKELNQTKIRKEMRSRGIRRIFQCSQASHIEGIYERVIRSIKRILPALSQQQLITDDLLLTLFAAVEFIINSRPLTPLLMNPEHDALLTPNHLIMLRGNYDHAPGIF